MENIQKSTIDFRCAAKGCQNHQIVEFETISEVVQDDAWILPEGWKEVEVSIDRELAWYICCPYHDIKLIPLFFSHQEAET